MKFFRDTYIRNILLFLVGVTFLNMSFFLMEVSLLKLKKNKGLIEAISKLASGAGFEEDRDIGEESSSGNTAKEKEIDLLAIYNLSHHADLVRAVKEHDLIARITGLHGGYFETFSPPPEC